MRSIALRHGVAAALLAALAATARPAPAADLAAGKAKAAVCAACHGPAGISSMAGSPSLAGQQERYLQWQLVFFRSGRRANPIMGPLAKGLSDDDVKNLAAYYASLPHTWPAAGTPPADGAQIAARHRCAACHGDDFMGSQAAPSVARQRRDYLTHALTDYRATTRPSVGVAAMTEAAAELSDEDIASLAAYLGAFK